jgi:hypothetical protein
VVITMVLVWELAWGNIAPTSIYASKWRKLFHRAPHCLLVFPYIEEDIKKKVHNTIITTKLLLLFSRMGMNILHCCGVAIDNIQTSIKFTKTTIFFPI